MFFLINGALSFLQFPQFARNKYYCGEFTPVISLLAIAVRYSESGSVFEIFDNNTEKIVNGQHRLTLFGIIQKTQADIVIGQI